jgi:hypothetical protein|mmetsp:Transcript_66124/g.110946  ORF Transcript_66124/g.110946 Transcript_66124/m.110946 type:complete len:93 (+) Transcript_66124:2124-2402(+)
MQGSSWRSVDGTERVWWVVGGLVTLLFLSTGHSWRASGNPNAHTVPLWDPPTTSLLASTDAGTVCQRANDTRSGGVICLTATLLVTVHKRRS